MTPGTSDMSYPEILAAFPPRSIASVEDAAAMQAILDRLLDLENPTPAEVEYRNLLGDLIIVWEQGRYELPPVSPIERLCALIEDNGLRQRDLVPAVFPTESVASEVLRGKRPLTYEFVDRLTRFFHVPADLFFEQKPSESLNATEVSSRHRAS